MLLRKILGSIGLLCICSSAAATPSPYGVNFSYLLVGRDPDNFHGYRASFLYAPPSWVWQRVHIFLDAGYGHWWVTGNGPYSTISIYAIAPVFRFYFKNYATLSPFIDLSIGPSYMTKTRIDCRNLGEHFAFQDQVGFGVSFGQEKKLTMSFSILHYSNGSLSSMNAGITVPVMFNMSYRF